MNTLRHLSPHLQQAYLRARHAEIFAGTLLAGKWDPAADTWCITDGYDEDAVRTALLQLALAGKGPKQTKQSPYHNLTTIELLATLSTEKPKLRRQLNEIVCDNSPIGRGVSLVDIKRYLFDPPSKRELNIQTGEVYYNDMDGSDTLYYYGCICSPSPLQLKFVLAQIFAEEQEETYQHLFILDHRRNAKHWYNCDTFRYQTNADENVHVCNQPRITSNKSVHYLTYLRELALWPEFRLTVEERGRMLRTDPSDQSPTQPEEVEAISLLDRRAESSTGKRIKAGGVIRVVRGAIWRNTFTVNGRCYMDAKCYCCGLQDITVENYQAAHIVAHKNGGHGGLTNLRATCASCNLQMARLHMGAFVLARKYKGGAHLDPAVINGVPPGDLAKAKAAYAAEIDELTMEDE